MEEAKTIDEGVRPADNISLAESTKTKGSKISSSMQSTASSECLRAELDKVALLAQAAALKEKRALEEQELHLKAAQDELDVNIALATADAKLQMLQNYEGSVTSVQG